MIIDNLIKQFEITEVTIIRCSVSIFFSYIIIGCCTVFYIAAFLVVKCPECGCRVLITRIHFKEYKITCSTGTGLSYDRNAGFLAQAREQITT